jgi:hypothetical protein
LYDNSFIDNDIWYLAGGEEAGGCGKIKQATEQLNQYGNGTRGGGKYGSHWRKRKCNSLDLAFIFFWRI